MAFAERLRYGTRKTRDLLSQFIQLPEKGCGFPLHGRTYVGRWRILNAIDEGELEEFDDEVDNDEGVDNPVDDEGNKMALTMELTTKLVRTYCASNTE